MEFIRQIIIVDAQPNPAKELKERLQKTSKKLNVHVVSDRMQFTEVTSKLVMKAVYINGNIGKKDLFYILRFFSTFKNKDEEDIPVFLTSDDYGLIQDVLNSFTIEKLEIIPSPVSIDEVADRLVVSALGKKEKPKSRNSLNVDKEFLNVFILSTNKVISEMGHGAKIKAQKPTLLSKLKNPLNKGISSKIVLSSDFFKGTFFVYFPDKTFLSFYERVVSEKHDNINASNEDLASELANIIYGQSKKMFSEMGYHLEMAIPTIHKGDINHNPVYIIPFESDFGPFMLAIAPGLI